MPWIIAGGALLGGLMSSSATSSAASTQAGAAESGMEEQRRQFEAVRKLLQPYTEAGIPALKGLEPYAQAGEPALEQQQALLGLLGPEAQRAAISGVEQGEGFQAQVRQGEEALLQRASATGGLRGGNIQAALAQFRPQMLQQEIEKQYGRLGGLADIGRVTQQNLAQIGQSSATGTGTAGLNTGTNIANLMGQQGAAQAGGQLAAAAPFANLLGAPLQMAGMNYGRTGQFGLPGFGGLFGGSSGGGGGPVSMPGYGGMYDTATYMGR